MLSWSIARLFTHAFKDKCMGLESSGRKLESRIYMLVKSDKDVSLLILIICFFIKEWCEKNRFYQLGRRISWLFKWRSTTEGGEKWRSVLGRSTHELWIQGREKRSVRINIVKHNKLTQELITRVTKNHKISVCLN